MLLVDEGQLIDANRRTDQLRTTLRSRFDVSHATLECRIESVPECGLTQDAEDHGH